VDCGFGIESWVRKTAWLSILNRFSGNHPNRGAGSGIAVESFSQFAGHANASVRIGDSGEVAGVHADAASDAHEIRHGSPLESGSGGAAVSHDVHVADDDVARRVHVVAEEIGKMVAIFLDDAEISGGGPISFPTA